MGIIKNMNNCTFINNTISCCIGLNEYYYSGNINANSFQVKCK